MPYQTIISPDTLADHLDNKNWLILDCRSALMLNKNSYETYKTSHIVNAYFCNFTSDWFYEETPKAHNNEASHILKTLKNYGFNAISQIIIYDHDNSSTSDTIWLKLRSLGFKNVAVLQGGFASWLAKKLPITQSSGEALTNLRPNAD